jgi:hypothetical protein
MLMNENEIQTLSINEIDAVSGGVVEGGCIIYPIDIKDILTPSPTFP